MNDKDLRDCFAMFAMNGLLAQGLTDYSVATVAYKIADSMMKARSQETEPAEGIVAIKRKVKAK